MIRIRELVIGYVGGGAPVSAACSLCDEWMIEEDVQLPPAAETVARFLHQFSIHIRQKHPSKGVN